MRSWTEVRAEMLRTSPTFRRAYHRARQRRGSEVRQHRGIDRIRRLYRAKRGRGW